MSGPKGPSLVRTENLPPWRWKIEKAPRHENPGPALQVSINSSQPGPLLEDGEELVDAPVDCIQNAKQPLLPACGSQGVIPLTDSPVLQDGQETQSLQSQCLENQKQEMIPLAGAQAVIPTDPGLVLESAKMKKSLV